MQSDKIPLRFYRTRSGHEPVRHWLKHLHVDDRKSIGFDMMRVQWRWSVGMPLCRPLDNGIWEIRSTLSGNRIARVLICFFDHELVALHGLLKKSRTTPRSDLKLAHKRKREIES
jgi:phage-related protein